ncbi:hypothetical protein ACFE04_005538 [Oxalis oulophora]
MAVYFGVDIIHESQQENKCESSSTPEPFTTGDHRGPKQMGQHPTTLLPPLGLLAMIKRTMKHNKLFITILLFSIFLPHIQPTSGVTNIDFIRKSCQTTSIPDLCYSSLSVCASTVNQNLTQLAKCAILVSLSKANNSVHYFANLTHSSDQWAAAASTPCVFTFRKAVDSLHDSIYQMHKIGRDVRLMKSNVLKYMNDVIPYENKCLEGFQAVIDESIKKDAEDRVDQAVDTTLVAIDLVNNLPSN